MFFIEVISSLNVICITFAMLLTYQPHRVAGYVEHSESVHCREYATLEDNVYIGGRQQGSSLRFGTELGFSEKLLVFIL